MTDIISNYQGNLILDTFLGAGAYVSLHVSDPTVTGNPATELSGGDYARQLTGWSAAGSKTSSNLAQLVFDNLPASTVTHIGIWTTAVGGNMRFSKNLTTALVIAASARVQMQISDIAITL